MRSLAIHLLALATMAVALPAQLPALEIQLPGQRTVSIAQARLRTLAGDTVRLVPHHGEPTLYRATSLATVMAAVGLSLDSLRVGRKAWTIIAEARDGYRVVFSVAELDPKLGPSRVWLAYETTSGPIAAAEAPYRLIVPTDARLARSIHQLVRLRVVDAAGG